ncbi:hypothetical protein F4604DRAFT_2042920 [Suillus subluteus]|nr:hypothetical protein F4604DRAFT_2042920 [Suillus subluteus]
MTCVESQLQELHLIQHSLLPSESFSLILPAEDSRIWTSLLHSFNTPTALPSLPSPVPQVKFQVKAVDARISFEVQFPERYPEDLDVNVPFISVNGENLSGDEHRRWRTFIQEKLVEVQGNESDYPICQLLCMHLLPKLHEDEHSIDTGLSESMAMLEQQSTNHLPETAHYHVLLTSHHLVSPTKWRSLQRWSSDLSISGFTKVGYPVVIYAQGLQENVEEFVANIKSMQWLALRVRFVEPIDLTNDENHQGWSEFQKVGEVVEEMRRCGSDKYITEMGIGSSVLK